MEDEDVMMQLLVLDEKENEMKEKQKSEGLLREKGKEELADFESQTPVAFS